MPPPFAESPYSSQRRSIARSKTWKVSAASVSEMRVPKKIAARNHLNISWGLEERRPIPRPLEKLPPADSIRFRILSGFALLISVLG